MIRFVVEAVADEGNGMVGDSLYKQYEWPVLPDEGHQFEAGGKHCEVIRHWHHEANGRPTIIVEVLVDKAHLAYLRKQDDWKYSSASALVA